MEVLKARMLDGSLPQGVVHGDARKLTGGALPGRVDGIVSGFPCQDISFAGGQQGLKGRRSSLVFELLRLVDETRCTFVFLENVAHICRMPGVWQTLFDELRNRGFAVKWCVLEASHVGAPQCRPRWFALARRGPASLQLSAEAFPEGRSANFPSQAGLLFNGGRPDPASWLLPRSDFAQVSARLDMLGNAVVPQQAALAARLLGL